MSDYTLWLGDCLDRMSQIEDGSIDMILADLPYNSIDAKWDGLIPLEPLWKQYRRILKPNGVTVLTAQDEFSAILLLSNRIEYRHKWIWEKDTCGNFLAARYMPRRMTEEILIFSKAGFAVNSNNKSTYNPQMIEADTYIQPVKRKPREGLSINQIRIRPNHQPLESDPNYNGWLRYPKNIIYFSVDKERFHPTQKPVALLSYLIKTYTNEGETVLDNTMGSGSTGEACLRTNRRFIGIEKDPGYFEIASQRLARVAAELRGDLNHLPMFVGVAV